MQNSTFIQVFSPPSRSKMDKFYPVDCAQVRNCKYSKFQIWIQQTASYLKYSHINDVFHCNSVKYYPSLLSTFALWIEISSFRNDIWFLPLLLRSTFFPPPTLQTSIMYQYIILERKQQFWWLNNIFFKTRIQEQGTGKTHSVYFETLTIGWVVIDDAHQINDK